MGSAPPQSPARFPSAPHHKTEISRPRTRHDTPLSPSSAAACTLSHPRCALRKAHLRLSFPFCLSRACLGKMIFCSTKWNRKRCSFRTRRLGHADDVSHALQEIKRARGVSCEKRRTFLNFSYICPEPGLVKGSFVYINCSKRGVFRTVRPAWVREATVLRAKTAAISLF